MSAELSGARNNRFGPRLQHLKGAGQERAVVSGGNDVSELMRAASTGQVDLAQDLLERGVDVNCRRQDGFTPLLLAAFYGYQEMVEMLLVYGADAAVASRFATSADMWADARGFFTIAKILREAKSARLVADQLDFADELTGESTTKVSQAAERVGALEEQSLFDEVTEESASETVREAEPAFAEANEIVNEPMGGVPVESVWTMPSLVEPEANVEPDITIESEPVEAEPEFASSDVVEPDVLVEPEVEKQNEPVEVEAVWASPNLVEDEAEIERESEEVETVRSSANLAEEAEIEREPEAVETVWSSANLAEKESEIERESEQVETVWSSENFVEEEAESMSEPDEAEAVWASPNLVEAEVESEPPVPVSDSVWASPSLAEAETEFESAPVEVAPESMWEESTLPAMENQAESEPVQVTTPQLIPKPASHVETGSAIKSDPIVEEVIIELMPQQKATGVPRVEDEALPLLHEQVSDVAEPATAPKPKRGTRVLDETWEPPPFSDRKVSRSTEPVSKQPKPQRASRVLDETWEPPVLVDVETGPTYHPGQIFLSRVSSSWTSVAVTTLVVMVICGAAAFAFIKWRDGSLALTLPTQPAQPTQPSKPSVVPETYKAITPAETKSVKKAETNVKNKFEVLSSSASGEVIREEENAPPEIPVTGANRTRTSSAHANKPGVASSAKRTETPSKKQPDNRTEATAKKETEKVSQPTQDTAPGNGAVRARTVTRKSPGESISSGIVSPKPKSKVIQWP